MWGLLTRLGLGLPKPAFKEVWPESKRWTFAENCHRRNIRSLQSSFFSARFPWGVAKNLPKATEGGYGLLSGHALLSMACGCVQSNLGPADSGETRNRSLLFCICDHILSHHVHPTAHCSRIGACHWQFFHQFLLRYGHWGGLGRMEYGASNLETGLNKTQRNDASAWLFV